MVNFKENKNIQEEIKMFKQYTSRKLKELERTLDLLIKFARDDMERLDKIEEKFKNE